jgi:hypothetical protein
MVERKRNQFAPVPEARHKIPHLPDVVLVEEATEVGTVTGGAGEVLPEKMPAVFVAENFEREFAVPRFANGKLFNLLLNPKLNLLGHISSGKIPRIGSGLLFPSRPRGSYENGLSRTDIVKFSQPLAA